MAKTLPRTNFNNSFSFFGDKNLWIATEKQLILVQSIAKVVPKILKCYFTWCVISMYSKKSCLRNCNGLLYWVFGFVWSSFGWKPYDARLGVVWYPGQPCQHWVQQDVKAAIRSLGGVLYLPGICFVVSSACPRWERYALGMTFLKLRLDGGKACFQDPDPVVT